MRPDHLHPRGAELEIRDIAEGIERRAGQFVGGRLDEGGGNEHHAVAGASLLRLRYLLRQHAGRECFTAALHRNDADRFRRNAAAVAIADGAGDAREIMSGGERL